MPVMSSIKSMLGHTMGAASALGAIACALAISRGFIPPTINFTEPDPECPVDCVPNDAREAELNVIQNNGFAFGGNNAITILGRDTRSEEHTSELQSRPHLVCRLLLEKKKKKNA